MTGIRSLASKWVLALLLGLSCVAVMTASAQADERRYRERESHDHEYREREFRDRRFLDSRYGHGHYYPPLGHQFRILPASPFVTVYAGNRFFFSAGVWYRPYGNVFVVAAPPFGILTPVLPPYYSEIWVGGIPYYYANNVYYAHRPDGYVVVPEPTGNVVLAPTPSANGVTELGPAGTPQSVVPAPPTVAPSVQPIGPQAAAAALFVYPRQGQSTDQQRKDRSECDAWAGGQVNPASGADYQRALSACMDARGYTVK